MGGVGKPQVCWRENDDLQSLWSPCCTCGRANNKAIQSNTKVNRHGRSGPLCTCTVKVTALSCYFSVCPVHVLWSVLVWLPDGLGGGPPFHYLSYTFLIVCNFTSLISRVLISLCKQVTLYAISDFWYNYINGPIITWAYTEGMLDPLYFETYKYEKH